MQASAGGASGSTSRSAAAPAKRTSLRPAEFKPSAAPSPRRSRIHGGTRSTAALTSNGCIQRSAAGSAEVLRMMFLDPAQQPGIVRLEDLARRRRAADACMHADHPGEHRFGDAAGAIHRDHGRHAGAL